jgi:hypothetical protein
MYKTRSGLTARILATDLKDENYPVLAAVLKDGQEYLYQYTVDLTYHLEEESPLDLFPDRILMLEEENQRLLGRIRYLESRLWGEAGS